VKLRRAIFGSIVLGGVLVLVLGIAGVFSPDVKQTPSYTPPEAEPEPDPGVADPAASTAGPVVAMKTVFESFEATGKDWVLTAVKGRLDPERGILLVEPLLKVERKDSRGEQRMEARADRGTFTRKPKQHVAMSGHVRVEFTGEEHAVLLTDSLGIDLDTAVGRTDAEIEFTATTSEGRHVLFGRGAELLIRDRVARMLKEIRAETSGGAALFAGPDAREEKPPSTAVTRLSCRGPAIADGFRRTVVLQSDVLISQGESSLQARRVEARFGEALTEPERFTAEGDVRFKAADADGRCDRLVRTAADQQIVLTGRPALIRQGASEIVASKIVMDLAAGRVLTPVRGHLKIAQPDCEEGAGQTIEVKWGNAMRFSRARQEAVFRGDVRFSYGGQQVSCQILTIRFDEASGQLLECRAEENVKVLGRIDAWLPPEEKGTRPETGPISASAREMSYDFEKESLCLVGDARLERAGQIVSGDRIELDQRTRAIRVIGAGKLDVTQRDGEDLSRLKVAWAGGMDFNQSSREVRFRRAVSMAYQGRTLTADQVTAKIREDNTLKRFDAVGNVVLKEAPGLSDRSRAFRADRVTATVGADNAVEAFEADGHVVIEEEEGPDAGARKLYADRVTARVGSGRRIERFDAAGNVRLEQDDAEITGDRLAWDLVTDFGTLTGSPVEFRQGRQRITGDHVEFSEGRARVRITSKTRVEATLVTADRNLRDLLRP